MIIKKSEKKEKVLEITKHDGQRVDFTYSELDEMVWTLYHLGYIKIQNIKADYSKFYNSDI